MESIGLKELRQRASEYVKRAEAGETLMITVAGREAAILGPVTRRQWNSFDSLEAVFAVPSDPALAIDLGEIDDEIRDPWAPR